MDELKTCSLSSGSSGNAVYIGCGQTHILIDAGRSAKALTNLLEGFGVKIGSLSAVFITHEHIDHVSALKILINRTKIPVYMVWESFNNLGEDYKDALGGVINFIKPGEDKIRLGGLDIQCYPVPHDSAANVGYIISYGDTKAVGVVTDIGYMSKQVIESVCGCKILYIESNHDLEMLKTSSYPEYLKQRIKSKTGHLSNKECAETLPYFIKHGTEKIILYHLSGENNIKELALKESKRSILAAKLNAGTVHLGVAPKSAPSRMISMRINTEKRVNAGKIIKKIKTRELPEVEF
ncbi:MAG: MBL fold metallo-hydrolase [Oscillospiraceae bacterium]|nr:MBL fold metallo-hydrolase [Oscillospiraceae bacterium]